MQEGVLNLRLVPETWIIAPIVTKEQLNRYIAKGWLTDDDAAHLDRAFPRNSRGEPIIFRMWLRSPLNQVVNKHNFDRNLLDFRILDDKGIEVNYVVINDQPLRYRRNIEVKGKKTTEYFEYIDGTYELNFKVKVNNPKEFVEAFALAGRVGLLSRTKHGYGKFNIEILESL